MTSKRGKHSSYEKHYLKRMTNEQNVAGLRRFLEARWEDRNIPREKNTTYPWEK